MGILIHNLQYFVTNISTILQSSIFLLGSILVLIPVFHYITNTDKSKFTKASKACLHRLGFGYFTQPTTRYTALAQSPYLYASALSSADDVTEEFNSTPIDTQICLLPEYSNSMVSGLANTGNSCFLNSVLQSLSSLPKLQVYLDQVSAVNSSTRNLPVTQSLLKTLRLLSTPSDNTVRPTDIINALKSNHRVINREQQDAQELYQLLVSELESETTQLNKKQGLRDILSLGSKKNKTTILENPLTGLLAYRVSCMQCGYTSGIPMHSFNNVQLTLPNTDNTTLDQCLEQLTGMEYLTDVECSKCSLISTVQALSAEIESLSNQSNKIDKKQCLEKVKQEIEHRLRAGMIELEDGKTGSVDKLKGMVTKAIGVKSKQAMFAKPPKVLCLHFVRSLYLPTGDMVKNTCQVEFPEILDLTPYCTNGTLETQPHLPISTPDHLSSTRYRLMSTVVHYGDHYSGHYIAYKRRMLADQCSCNRCGHQDTQLKSHESHWFKISDDRVMLCEAQDALSENPFMLMYELIEDPQDTAPIATHAPELPVQTPPHQEQVEAQEEEEEETDETDEEDWLHSSVPAAPPSSPLLEPITYTKPRSKHVNNKNRHNITPLKLSNHHSIPILTQ